MIYTSDFFRIISGRWDVTLSGGEKLIVSIDSPLQTTDTQVTFKLDDGVSREVKYSEIKKCVRID